MRQGALSRCDNRRNGVFIRGQPKPRLRQLISPLYASLLDRDARQGVYCQR